MISSVTRCGFPAHKINQDFYLAHTSRHPLPVITLWKSILYVWIWPWTPMLFLCIWNYTGNLCFFSVPM